MGKIFISYRREDSADVTGRIGDRLREHFGKGKIFTDVDDIPLGIDFRAHLENEVSQCNVLLAVIGKDWLSAKNSNGELRLNDSADFVRIEIESALRRDIPVIPLLVRGASIPQKSQLPESIEALAFRNAQKIRPDPDFKNDTNRLVQSLINHFKSDNSDTSPEEKPFQNEELVALQNELLAAKSNINFELLNNKIEKHHVQQPNSTEAQNYLDQVDKTRMSKNSRLMIDQWLRGNSTWLGAVATIAAVIAWLPDTLKVAPTDFIPPDMVLIPQGAFMMGSDSGQDNEKPVHQVTVPAFELARNELTWAEWQLCEEAGDCAKIERPSFLGKIDEDEQLSHPVENLHLRDVNDYLTWISRKTGQNYRLPSETEWEYAARAGTDTEYHWGESIGRNQANCDGCGSEWDARSTAPVGSFGANQFGLNDLHGNVFERVADCWHADYAEAPADGSPWVDDCLGSDSSVLRGGAWNSPPIALRVTFRGFIVVRRGSYSIGFRLARTLSLAK